MSNISSEDIKRYKEMVEANPDEVSIPRVRDDMEQGNVSAGSAPQQFKPDLSGAQIVSQHVITRSHSNPAQNTNTEETPPSPQTPTYVKPIIQEQPQQMNVQNEIKNPYLQGLQKTTPVEQPHAEPQVSHNQVEPTLADSSPDWFEITSLMPSSMIAYDFNRISARLVSLKDQFKINSCTATGDQSAMLPCLGSMIDRDINKITNIDMEAIVFWLRMNSYTSDEQKLTIDWKCNAHEHNKRVLLGELDKATLNNSTAIESKEPAINKVPASPDTPVIQIAKQLTGKFEIEITLPLMVDTMWVIKNIPEDDALSLLHAQFAVLLSPRHGSMSDRLKLIRSIVDRGSEQDCELIGLLNKLHDEIMQYGVDKRTKVKCSTCGAESEVTIQVDNLLYLFPFGK